MPISYDKLWKLLIDKKMNRLCMELYFIAFCHLASLLSVCLRLSLHAALAVLWRTKM